MAFPRTSTFPGRATRLVLVVIALVVGLVAADTPKPLTAEDLKADQARFQTEYDAAVKAGLEKVFSPDWFTRAGQFAKAGRTPWPPDALPRRAKAIAGARWQIPTLPPDFLATPPASSAMAASATRTTSMPSPTTATDALRLRQPGWHRQDLGRRHRP
jgi:hypothetical protein